MSSQVTLYTTRFCPYCLRAKQLLSHKKVDFNEVAVDGDRELFAEMQRLSGRRTVPQIWIGEEHIGGCDELYKLERQGVLDSMLGVPVN